MTTASRKAAKAANLQMLVHINQQTEKTLQDVDIKVRENATKKLIQSLDPRTAQVVLEEALIKLDQKGLRSVAVRAVQSADRTTVDAVRRALPQLAAAPVRPNTTAEVTSRPPALNTSLARPSLAKPTLRARYTEQNESQTNGLIFALGGIDKESLTNVEMFDTESNKWSTIASMKVKRSFAAAASMNGKVYVVGGDDLCRKATAEVLDVAAGKWSFIAGLDICRMGHCLVALDNCLYAIGGTSGRVPLERVDHYDPTKNEWSSVEDLRQKRSYLAACTFSGKIMVAGGHGESGVLSTSESYDLITGRWKFEGQLSMPRRGASLAAWRDHLFIFGGEASDIECNSVEEYDFRSSTWTQVCGQDNRRVLFGTVTLNDRIYLLGGNSQLPVEFFDPNKRLFSDKIRTLPTRRSNFAVCSCEMPQTEPMELE